MNDDFIKHLKNEKWRIVAEKKASIKKADAASSCIVSLADRRDALKAEAGNRLGADIMQVEAVINTTGLFDSHDDVHIPGLWDKSLANLRLVYLLQEHEREFDHVISDEIKVSVQEKSWAELAAPFEGSTQALVFNATVHRRRNPYMFDQYMNGYVRNHSVGMYYKAIELCINSEEPYYADEKKAWDKYIEYVANRDDVEEAGYFWAVTEAEVVEGSAVLFGSNWVTPTINVDLKDNTSILSKIGRNFH